MAPTRIGILPGTGSSNPALSSGESIANLTFGLIRAMTIRDFTDASAARCSPVRDHASFAWRTSVLI
jgi:hypothetical protein